MRAIEREYPARAFDTSAIAPQIKHVRQDYGASAQRRWRPAYFRAGMFAAAQRMVASFTYFRHKRQGNELHDHDA
jgi:hypothetical protein